MRSFPVAALSRLGALTAASMLSAAVLPTALASCSVGDFCYSDALLSAPAIQCIPSQYCPGGVSAQLCPGGSYCSTPLVIAQCPSGHYCPPGTVVPIGCSPLASCPAGSDRYFHAGALVLTVLLLALLAAAPYLYSRITMHSRRKTHHVPAGSAAAAAGAGGASHKSAVPLMSPTGGVAVANGSGALSSPSASAAAADSPVPRMEVAFSNLCAAVDVSGTEKIILADVSGHFRPGRLAAVMGPSGAGQRERQETRGRGRAWWVAAMGSGRVVAHVECVCRSLACACASVCACLYVLRQV